MTTVAKPDPKIPGTLRFLTLNLWGENGPWQDRMELLLDGLVAIAPDVIGLQEVLGMAGLHYISPKMGMPRSAGNAIIVIDTQSLLALS